MKLQPINNFSDFMSAYSWQQRLRSKVRDSAVVSLSPFKRIPRKDNWIRFPYYHHVFNDERESFARQLKYMKNFGDFISLDDAIEMLESDSSIQGRYFCITFDDGFKNCATNAVPILINHNAPASFFLPTKYIGSASGEALDFWLPIRVSVEFLNWEDCREMMRSGMSFGAHTVSHRLLIDLSDTEVEKELRDSKEHIEREFQIPCQHFCCPVGQPDIDFSTNRDPEIARRLGYRSFLTTRRGSASRKPKPMLLERDHVIAGWSNHQLRYFFSF